MKASIFFFLTVVVSVVIEVGAVLTVVDDELVWLVLIEVVDTVEEAGEGGKEFKLSWKRRRGLVCLEEILEVGESGIVVLTIDIPVKVDVSFYGYFT